MRLSDTNVTSDVTGDTCQESRQHPEDQSDTQTTQADSEQGADTYRDLRGK